MSRIANRRIGLRRVVVVLRVSRGVEGDWSLGGSMETDGWMDGAVLWVVMLGSRGYLFSLSRALLSTGSESFDLLMISLREPRDC